MVKDLNCIACGSRVIVELQGLFDTRFGIESAWNICRCIDCGMEQTLPVPSPGELKKLYEEYYNFGGEKGTSYTKSREVFFSSFLVFGWHWMATYPSIHAVGKGGCWTLAAMRGAGY